VEGHDHSPLFARASRPEIAEVESRITNTHAWGRDKAGQIERAQGRVRFG
jgi:hypothetical protein